MMRRLKVVEFIIVLGFSLFVLNLFLMILIIDIKILGVFVLNVIKFKFVIVLF